MIESALLSPDGNVLRVLRGRMPKLAGAETKAKAKKTWELIYKDGTTKREPSPRNHGQDPWHSTPWTLPHSILPVTMSHSKSLPLSIIDTS